MQESVIYQDILQEVLQQGLQNERSLILRLLTRRVGEISPALKDQVEDL